MTFGILDSNRLEHVPGTSLLDEVHGHGNIASSNLKRGTDKNAHIVLVPQPSNDLNDPLRWPLWQRDLLLFLYLYCTILCVGGIGPLLSASAFILLEEFQVGFTEITLLTGYHLCAVGAAGIFISTLCHKYGKRPGFLFSMAFAFIGTVWGGASQSYDSLLGARIVQGLGVSMFESVMFAVIGDLYYVHERGTRVAALTIAISGLANLPALLSGVTTQNLGWRWMFWLLSIFMGVALVAVILFGWETAFNRAAIYNTDTSSSNEGDQEVEHKEKIAEAGLAAEENPVPRIPFPKRLLPFSGTYSSDSIPLMLIRPFTILANPAVIWSTLILSITTAWFIVISFVIAQIFSSPPYLLDSAHIGYMSAGSCVGGLLGSIACGMVSDPIVVALSKMNKGIFEPEFRLVLLIPFIIFSSIGFFCFGNFVALGYSPVVISVIWGVATVAQQFISVVVGTYMIDAYRDISVEVFIIGMVVKNFLFFGLSFGVNDWVTSWGPARVFNTIGGIEVALFVFSIPIWVWGKQWRAYFHSKHIS
ncbi:MFS general substrate transporter [Cadophora sp. DSE1049]|nr:MFS general substrate transporter [Cadophora sp. DSE1049]